MRLTKTTIAVEIVILLAVLVAVEWLATILTHTRNFLALVIFAVVYLGIRLAMLSRRRSGGMQRSH